MKKKALIFLMAIVIITSAIFSIVGYIMMNRMEEDRYDELVINKSTIVINSIND